MLSVPACEVCGGTMQPKGSWVWRCPKCGFLASTLQPDGGTGIDGLEDLRKQNFRTMLDQLNTIRPLAGQKVLEVGCAWGWFLDAAAQRGMNVHGIEPEQANAQMARHKGHRVDCGFFPQDLADHGPYDMVVFNDVFEHLPHPAQMMRRVDGLLKPGGLAVFNIPSSRGILFRVSDVLRRLGRDGLYARLWQKGFASPHVSYFSPDNLQLLADNNSSLEPLGRFPLPAVSRRGLYARIKSSHTGMVGLGLFGGLWLASFIFGLLPADIEVLILRKSGQ